jgi:hypothetical protein
MMTGCIEAVLHTESDYTGALDSVRFTIRSDGSIHIIRFCDSEIDDVFVEEPVRYHIVIDDVSAIFDAVCDEGIPCNVITEDGLREPRHIPADVLTSLKDEYAPDTGSFSVQNASPEILSKMLSDGIIDREKYDSMMKDHESFIKRKDEISKMISDASYPFVRDDADILQDHKLRLISDEQYDMFVWYRRNRVENCQSGTEKSFKLKLSCEGLRIMGRYDLCEYSCRADSNEMTKRLYCFRGTLFEGCGNVKAPDDATYIELSEQRHRNAFRYLSELKQMGILGQNCRESPFSSFFFDLYVRYEGQPMSHTKGTADFPYFIKMLMFIIGAENIY